MPHSNLFRSDRAAAPRRVRRWATPARRPWKSAGRRSADGVRAAADRWWSWRFGYWARGSAFSRLYRIKRRQSPCPRFGMADERFGIARGRRGGRPWLMDMGVIQIAEFGHPFADIVRRVELRALRERGHDAVKGCGIHTGPRHPLPVHAFVSSEEN